MRSLLYPAALLCVLRPAHAVQRSKDCSQKALNNADCIRFLEEGDDGCRVCPKGLLEQAFSYDKCAYPLERRESRPGSGIFQCVATPYGLRGEYHRCGPMPTNCMYELKLRTLSWACPECADSYDRCPFCPLGRNQRCASSDDCAVHLQCDSGVCTCKQKDCKEYFGQTIDGCDICALDAGEYCNEGDNWWYQQRCDNRKGLFCLGRKKGPYWKHAQSHHVLNRGTCKKVGR